MMEGWFRSDSAGRQTFDRYFNDTTEDAYGAREIINGDKKTVPSWSNGVSIGNLIKGYYTKFLAALSAAAITDPEPAPDPDPDPVPVTGAFSAFGHSVDVMIDKTLGVSVVVDGEQIVT